MKDTRSELSTAAGFLKLTGQRQGATGEKLAVGLTIQPGVRVRNDAATFTQQERIAGAAEIQRVDGIGHGGQADVTTEYPEQVDRVADPGHRRDQDFAGGGVLCRVRSRPLGCLLYPSRTKGGCDRHSRVLDSRVKRS